MIKWYKKSLANKILFLSSILFYFLFTVFTVAAFNYIDYLLLSKEKATIVETATDITTYLSQKDSLTLGELANVDVKRVQDGKNIYLLGEGKTLTIGRVMHDNQELAIFNQDKKLVYITDKEMKKFQVNRLNETQAYHSASTDGYYLTTPVYSRQTGILLGYSLLLHKMDSYYSSRSHLLVLLIIYELSGVTLLLLVTFVLVRRFLKPLKNLHQVIKNIADDPSDLHVRSHIKTGDEIEGLSLIFDDMLDRIEDYTQQQTRFISDVSHELRTPVAVIKGHVGLLQRWGKEDPEILDESLAATYHEADRMSIMINDMLSIVRLQGSLNLHQGEIANLNESIKSVLANFKILHPEFEFQFLTSLKEDVFGEIYKNHFEQALLILLDNGVKYSAKTKEISISLEVSEESAIVKVTDKGDGISDEDIKHIFERFYRTDKSRTRSSSQAGLGIGLAILQQISDAYHFDVSVTSELGKGTEFSLVIPLGNPEKVKID